jgi:hypothetical protein
MPKYGAAKRSVPGMWTESNECCWNLQSCSKSGFMNLGLASEPLPWTKLIWENVLEVCGPFNRRLDFFNLKIITRTEYVGEIVGNEVDGVATFAWLRLDHLHETNFGYYYRMIRKFLDRNYAFGLLGSISLDSHSLGNETRYLNHSKHPNCVARCKVFFFAFFLFFKLTTEPRVVVMVNGDMKIGIYTSMSLSQSFPLPVVC